MSPTITIDDPDDGGSEPGAWRTAIATTPSLATHVVDGEAFEEELDAND